MLWVVVVHTCAPPVLAVSSTAPPVLLDLVLALRAHAPADVVARLPPIAACNIITHQHDKSCTASNLEAQFIYATIQHKVY